jgi:glycine cleavage system H lipoate-binding protein
MDSFSLVDIYATKGIEYLVAVVFFFGFLALQWYMLQPAAEGPEHAPAPRRSIFSGRFIVPDGYSFHPGHAWMKAEPMMRPDLPEVLVRVGMDDFAQKLVGKADAVQLPTLGTRLSQGDKGWSLVVDSVPIPMLSPVDGEVVAVNQEILRSPELLNRDPYGKGWLFKVKSDRIPSDTRNLLSGKFARTWMENALENLTMMPVPGLGPVMQDGGMLVEGFPIAKAIGGDRWQDLAKAHLLTEEV